MKVEKEVIILLFAPLSCAVHPQLCDYFLTRLLSPWNFPGKKTEMGCNFLLQGNLPNPGIKPMSLTSPEWTGRFFTTSATWEDDKSLSRNNTLPRG